MPQADKEKKGKEEIMCVHISIEVLAANAIIGILKSAGGRFVSFKMLDKYGVKVAEKLMQENETAYWIYSKEQVDAFFADYSDMFKRDVRHGFAGIQLTEPFTEKDLIARFQMHLSWKLEQALMDPEILEEVFKKAA